MKIKQYKVEIDNWHPTSVNKLIKKHWRSAHRHKQADMQMIGTYAYNAKIPKAKGQRHVQIEIHISGGGRAPDPDNILKSVLDALVKLGYLKDDSGRWCAFANPQIFREGVKKTVIQITEM